MGAKIDRMAYYLPDSVLSNTDLASINSGWKPEKVEKKVGIRNRHIAKKGETALDLAEQAARELLVNANPDEIDFILFCTQSPEYLLPTSACILQDRLGFRTDIGALDFNLGCSGYIYGLALSKGLINSGLCKKVLLLTGETYSKFLSPDDISNRSIFGDAASATLICHSEDEHLGEFEFGTDGRGADNLIVNNLTARESYHSDSNAKPELFMNGPEIFNFTIDMVPPLVKKVLAKNKLNKDEIDYTILHQANKYILEFLIDLVGLQKDKCHIDMLEYGNTVSNTIPIALKDANDRGIVHAGDKVLLTGFGVGYSWGSTIITI